jgi:hypothetical protein
MRGHSLVHPPQSIGHLECRAGVAQRDGREILGGAAQPAVEVPRVDVRERVRLERS